MEDMKSKLEEAQKYGMSIRPKVGGFPYLAEALRQAGVRLNKWSLPSCQSTYIMTEGSVVQQGNPLVMGTHEIPRFDRELLIRAIREDQNGSTNFREFLDSAWKAGVVGYDADFENRKICYYGSNGETYIEEYPAVILKKV